MKRGASVVLLYHRIAEEPTDPLGMCVSPEHFDEQLDVLVRVADVVPASRIPTAPPGSTAITFDDGYSDVFSEGLPRLERRGIPSTVFAVTEHLEHGCGYWWDRLAAALFVRERSRPVRVTIGGKTRSFAVGAGISRRIAMRLLFPRLRAMPDQDRRNAIAELERGAPAPAMRDLPSVATWDVVRGAASDLHEVGSHTLSHPLLSVIDGDAQRAEIADSKRVLEEGRGAEVRTFAYPFGAPGTFDDESVGLVREAGYACAFTNIPGSFRAGEDVFRIPRRVVGNWPGPVFEKRLRGWLGSR